MSAKSATLPLCFLLLAYSTVATAQYSATLIETKKVWGSAMADYNGDGHDDIFLTGHDTDDRIFYWTAGGYRRSAQSLELRTHSDRHDCAPADIDLDGRVDFYCAVGSQKGKGVGDNELWIQQPNGSHTMVGLQRDFGAKDPTGRGRRPVFFDFNQDGYPDIYISNMAVLRADGLPNINRVFINDQHQGFTEVVTAATGMFGSMCAVKGDINGDGRDDLVVCADEGAPHIFINDASQQFVQIAPPTGRSTPLPLKVAKRDAAPPDSIVAPQDLDLGDWTDAKLADMDGDGRDDLVIVTRDNLFQIWRNTGTGSYFTEILYEEQFASIAASIAIGDFNHDGKKDVYVVLRDPACEKTLRDLVDDVWYASLPEGGWRKVQLSQGYTGCGHLADVIDGDKVVLANGGSGWKGPNYVLKLE